MIPECENKTCVEITLDSLQDNVVTGNRTFTINLMESEKLEDKRIKINTSSSILTVKENDSGMCIFFTLNLFIYTFETSAEFVSIVCYIIQEQLPFL